MRRMKKNSKINNFNRSFFSFLRHLLLIQFISAEEPGQSLGKRTPSNQTQQSVCTIQNEPHSFLIVCSCFLRSWHFCCANQIYRENKELLKVDKLREKSDPDGILVIEKRKNKTANKMRHESMQQCRKKIVWKYIQWISKKIKMNEQKSERKLMKCNNKYWMEAIEMFHIVLRYLTSNYKN